MSGAPRYPKKKVWNKEMDDYLRANYKCKSNEEMAIELSNIFFKKISKGAVCRRKHSLGLANYTFGHNEPGRISHLKIGKKLIRMIYVYDGEFYRGFLLKKPLYYEVAPDLNLLKEKLKRLMLRYLGAREDIWTWEKVNEARRLYMEGTPKSELQKRFGNYVYQILKNNEWYDPNYHGKPIPKREPPQPKQTSLTLFGETKKISQWSKDPRCQVSKNLLYKRYHNGIRDESILIP